MNKSNILKLSKLLGLKNSKPLSDDVMFSCPFAKKRHKKGTDRNPSFGVSISRVSRYNCFSCGVGGFLFTLPSTLAFEHDKDYNEAQKFIMMNESIESEEYDTDIERPRVLPAVNLDILTALDEVPESIMDKIDINKNTVRYFKLKYDRQKERVVMPIYDSFCRLVGLKGRYVGNDQKTMRDFKFIYIQGKDIKKNGTWYNMHKELTENKAIVLTESESDTMALQSTGLINNIWCSMGAKVTPFQILTLQQLGKPLIFFFDDDKEGDSAKKKILDKLKDDVLLYEVTNYYGENDAKDLVLKNKIGHALNSIKPCRI